MGKRFEWIGGKCVEVSEPTQDEWHTGIKGPVLIKNCDNADVPVKKIIIDSSVYKVIVALCKEIKTEWQMLLRGVEDDETVFVTDYYIPKQTVTAASVTNLEPINKDLIERLNIVAGIHSHAQMACFFSPTDDEMNMGDILFNVVVNNKLDAKAVQKVTLPCGGIMLKEIEVAKTPDPEDVVEIVGLENIEKYTQVNNVVRHHHRNWKQKGKNKKVYDGVGAQTDHFGLEREIDRDNFHSDMYDY